jgi:hypothetical protein
MNKFILFTILTLFAVNAIPNEDVVPYDDQGTYTLVPNILNLGYSPDQLGLVVLTSNNVKDTFYYYSGYRLNQQNLIKIGDDTYDIVPSAFAFSSDSKWLIIGTSYGAVYGF